MASFENGRYLQAIPIESQRISVSRRRKVRCHKKYFGHNQNNKIIWVLCSSELQAVPIGPDREPIEQLHLCWHWNSESTSAYFSFFMQIIFLRSATSSLSVEQCKSSNIFLEGSQTETPAINSHPSPLPLLDRLKAAYKWVRKILIVRTTNSSTGRWAMRVWLVKSMHRKIFLTLSGYRCRREWVFFMDGTDSIINMLKRYYEYTERRTDCKWFFSPSFPEV